MLIPVKSERDAFRLVYGGVVVLGVSVALGAAAEPVYGVILFVGVLFGVLAWEFARTDPDRILPLAEAHRMAREAAADDRHCVLVVANQTVAGSELRKELAEYASRKSEIRVVCPILPSRAHVITSDIDRELAEARERLDRTLAWAQEHGLQIEGKVSAETPTTAVADELRVFPADEIIVSTHPRSRSKWLDDGLIERMRDELEIPVHHVVVDLERAQQPV